MKTPANLFLLTVLSFLLATAIFGSPMPMPMPMPMPTPHEGNDDALHECLNGRRTDGNYYTDCYHPKGGDTGDTDRLKRALYDIQQDSNAPNGSGKLIFNEAYYYVYDQLDIGAGTQLEGLGKSTLFGPTIIHFVGDLIGTNTHTLFFIGANKHHITIRDLGFYNELGSTTNGNIAIRIEGYDSTTPNSTNMVFDNLNFENFYKGMDILSTTDPMGWQFDSARVSNTSFTGCQWGMHLRSDNANLELENVVFNSYKARDDAGTSTDHDAQNGLWIERGGYVMLKYVVGNGERAGDVAAAGTFIRIDRHGPVDISNAFGEAYQKELIIDNGPDNFQGYRFAPIMIRNSVLPACLEDGSLNESDPVVQIKNATVISEGNNWACNGPARPIVLGIADVHSTADRFCYESVGTSSNCFQHASGKRSEFVLKSNSATLRSDHSPEVDDLNLPSFQITNTPDSYSRPLLALTSSVWDNPGSGNIFAVSYKFTRKTSNGRLEIEGDETRPRAGFTFKNGPVQLTIATYSEIVTNGYYNVPGGGDSGSMLYCSDCTVFSTPCSGSGSGALAIRTGSQWNCK